MKIQCDKPSVTVDQYSGETLLSVHVSPESKHELNAIADMRDKLLTLELKRHCKVRSLDANAYCWVLMHKLAEVLNISPAEVYRNAIRDIGGNAEITPIRNDAVDTWINNWNKHGIGWFCEILNNGKLANYTNVINYYGSSVYDSRQMSQLIDVIITECKAQNIETMTPPELGRLKEGWHGK